MAVDNRMLMVAVAPAPVVADVDSQHGTTIRETGAMWTGDTLNETEIELEDADVAIRISVRRRCTHVEAP